MTAETTAPALVLSKKFAFSQKSGQNQLWMKKYVFFALLHFNKLRFILPYKRDCQPIFLKKQGIYSLYAKLWLVRPLIKNIPYSSHQYGSNVTFGASLASQMREEYVFEKKKNLNAQNLSSKFRNQTGNSFYFMAKSRKPFSLHWKRPTFCNF